MPAITCVHSFICVPVVAGIPAIAGIHAIAGTIVTAVAGVLALYDGLLLFAIQSKLPAKHGIAHRIPIHLKEELYLRVEVVSREASHCLNELGKRDSSAPVRVEHREDSLHEKFVSAGHDLSELV